jgi:hypothetical protein
MALEEQPQIEHVLDKIQHFISDSNIYPRSAIFAPSHLLVVDMMENDMKDSKYREN